MAEKHLTLRDFEDRVNKTNIVNGSSGKQGDYHSSEPGFYCKTCDMSLKDSLSYVDHLIDAKRMFSFDL